jgi:hypothetical protein
MLNQDIPEEFYARVEAVARQFQKGWSHLDWEDIRQEMWVFFLERRNQLKEAILDPTDTNLRVIAKQVVTALTEEENVAWGRYEYGTKHVRSMLDAGFLKDHRMGTLSEYHDLMNGLDRLSRSNQNSWLIIIDRFREGVEVSDKTGKVTKAIGRLTTEMNLFRIGQIEDHVGLNSDEPNPPFDVIEDMFGGDEELYYSNMH